VISPQYEYESEYESDSDDKKKAAAAKGGDTKAAAAASKPADTKAVAVATTTTKAADTKPAAKAPAATTATTTTTTTTTVVAAREVVAVKPRGVVEDPAHPWQPRKFVAEFLGTMIFCFVVYMSRMNQAPYGVYYGWPLGGMVSQALVQAFALIAVMAAFGGVSGGHFNPAVTLFMMLTRQTHVAIGLIYCIVQFAGAILGGALAWGLTSPLIINHMPNGQGTGYSAPITCTVFPISVAQANGTAPGGGYMNTINSNSGFSAGVNEWSCWPQAFGAEIMGSAIFIFLYGMLWVSGHGGMQHVSLGLALGMLVFAYEDISNAFFNPARALGSAAFAGVYQWTNFWVWIIGPICGAVIATLFWGLLYQRAWDRSIGSSVYSRGDHM
jgi:aquaporin Z